MQSFLSEQISQQNRITKISTIVYKELHDLIIISKKLIYLVDSNMLFQKRILESLEV